MNVGTDKRFVSVIVPAHQAMGHLADCLRALAAQSFGAGDYEVIVVDNGGNDGLEDLLAEYPVMRAIKEDAPGSYTARNAAIEHARGAILAFTDADCVPDREWIAEGVKALSAADELGIVGGRIELDLPGGEDRELNAAQIYEKYAAFNQQQYVELKRFAATANMFTLRQVLAEVGAFDARLYSGGDLEFGNRVADAGYGLKYADRSIIRHRVRGSLRELISKARRLAGGEAMLVRLGVRRLTARDRINLFVPPVIRSWRLLTDRRLAAPLPSKLVAIAVLNLLHLVAFVERLAIVLGKKPAR